MGMDFVALMKYKGPGERVVHALDKLESGLPEEWAILNRLMVDRGFRCDEEDEVGWEYQDRPELHDPRIAKRPALPDLSVNLHLPSGLFLTFGIDGIEIYHLLSSSFAINHGQNATTAAPIKKRSSD